MSINRSGQIIKRADVVADFNSDVRNVIQGRYVWTSSNHPSLLTQNIWGGSLPAMSEGNISTGIITASTLINNVVSFARDYTRVRKVQYIQTHVYNNVTYVDVDQTQIGLLNSNYLQNITGVTLGISRGAIIRQPNFADLMRRWESLCNNRVSFTVNTHTQYYNHSDRSRR